MMISDRHTVRGKLNLCLPYFTACNKTEAQHALVINTFYEGLEAEALSYAESTDDSLRSYTAKYAVSENGEHLHITVRLSARRIPPQGAPRTLIRDIRCKWHRGKLIDLTINGS